MSDGKKLAFIGAFVAAVVGIGSLLALRQARKMSGS